MNITQTTRRALVVSAHSADFVWRAGGAIALHAARGFEITVVCLSFGERGESQKLWTKKGLTLEQIKTVRREEAGKAAAILGVKDIRFFDLGDYPLRVPDDALYELVSVYRSVRPEFVLTHARQDPCNPDHPLASHVAQEARIIAQAFGHDPGTPPIEAPPVFLFEPHQTELCEWRPDVLLDISAVWEKKRAAFEAMATQENLWE
jgi:4-oxalomesaconate hydratase